MRGQMAGTRVLCWEGLQTAWVRKYLETVWSCWDKLALISSNGLPEPELVREQPPGYSGEPFHPFLFFTKTTHQNLWLKYPNKRLSETWWSLKTEATHHPFFSRTWQSNKLCLTCALYGIVNLTYSMLFSFISCGLQPTSNTRFYGVWCPVHVMSEYVSLRLNKI